MPFSFEKFQHTNQRFEDRISVTSGSALGFPTKFFNDNKLMAFKYVMLYYDKEQKAIGIKPTNDEQEKHKFSLLKYKNGNGGSVIATSFFKSYNIDPKIYQGRYTWTKETDPNAGELFVIILKEKLQKNNQSPTPPQQETEEAANAGAMQQVNPPQPKPEEPITNAGIAQPIIPPQPATTNININQPAAPPQPVITTSTNESPTEGGVPERS